MEVMLLQEGHMVRGSTPQISVISNRAQILLDENSKF